MLSQATGYAVTALGYVAAAGGKSVLVKDMAESCDIPAAYLAKIINSLARAKLVITQRGVGGGVVLAHPPTEMFLYDIAAALDDPAIQPRCLLGIAQCTDERACPAHAFWKGQREEYVNFLRQTTVADIAAFETRKRWHRPAPSDAPGGPAQINGRG
jgi:Rrf2 family transcriptional regulator, iron-sulfur cluster assembly transcription factor